MITVRLFLISTLVGGCAAQLQTPREPQAVGPVIGESTAMGPADSTRPLAAMVPGGVPEDVGPGVRITGAGPGTPPPTSAPTAVVEEQPIIVYPLEDQTPPPVFQPPPPPPPPDLSDQVFSEDEG